jgi:hypothetical protein
MGVADFQGLQKMNAGSFFLWGILKLHENID